MAIEAIAQWQTGPTKAEGNLSGPTDAFPAIAYTLVVDSVGDIYWCHDISTRCWHSGAVVDGRSRNVTHVGVAYIGNWAPNESQVWALVQARLWLGFLVGRNLEVEGHRDAPYPTSCPGPTWPRWREAIGG